MALRFLEGFEEYTTATGAALTNEMMSMRANASYAWSSGYYLGPSIFVTSDYTFSPQGSVGRSLALRNSHMDVSLASVSEIFIGVAVRFGKGEKDINTFLILTDATWTAGNPLKGIRLNRSVAGTLEIVSNATQVVIASSYQRCLLLDTWHYVELRYKFGVAGDLQVRVDGIEVANAPGVDTRGAAANIGILALNSSSPNDFNWFDDLYVCDTAGTSNNNFIGPLSVFTLAPVADAQADFMRNGGSTNFSRTNEIPHDSATTYVSSNTAGKRDLYTMTQVTANVGNAVGVQVNVRGKALNAAQTQVIPEVSSGAGLQKGAAKTQNTSGWITDFEVFERKSDGGVWTLADVNAIKAGFEIP